MTVTSTTNCGVSTDFLILTVDTIPISTLGANPPDICQGDTSAVIVGTAVGGSVTWSDGGMNGQFIPSANVTTVQYVPHPDSFATYTLVMSVTDPDGNCGTDMDTVILIVNVNPVANPGGPYGPICEGDAILLSGTSAGTILWTHDGSGTLTNATTDTPTYVSSVGDVGTVTFTLISTTALLIPMIIYSVVSNGG